MRYDKRHYNMIHGILLKRVGVRASMKLSNPSMIYLAGDFSVYIWKEFICNGCSNHFSWLCPIRLGGE